MSKTLVAVLLVAPVMVFSQREASPFQAYSEQLIAALAISLENQETNVVSWIPPTDVLYEGENVSLVEVTTTAPQFRQSFKATTTIGTPVFSLDHYSASSQAEALQMLCVAMGAPCNLPPVIFAESFCKTNLTPTLCAVWENNETGFADSTYLVGGKTVLHVYDCETNTVELINSIYQLGIAIPDTPPPAP